MKHFLQNALTLCLLASLYSSSAEAIAPCSEFSYAVENQTYFLKPFAVIHQTLEKARERLTKVFEKTPEQASLETYNLFRDTTQRNLDQEKYDFAEIDKLPVSRWRKRSLKFLVANGLASDKVFAFFSKVKKAQRIAKDLQSNARRKGPRIGFHKEKELDGFIAELTIDLLRPAYRWLVPFVSKYSERKYDFDDPYPWQRQTTVYKYPKLAKAFNVLDFIRESGLFFAYALTGLHTVAILGSDGGVINEADYTASVIRHDQVQILVESTPFPHTALRVGDRVYSYGYKRLQVSSFKEYVNIQNMAEWLKNGNGILGKFKSENKDFMRRTIQVVTLNLDPESVGKLQFNLENRKYQAYLKSECLHPKLSSQAFPYANNCSVMALKELAFNESDSILARIVPKRIYDSSPSTVVMYLTMLHLMGSELVENSFVVVTGDDEDVGVLIARNSFINFVDATLHAKFWFTNQSLRTAMESKHSDFHYKDPQYQALLSAAKKSWARYLEANRSFKGIRSTIEKATRLDSKAERQLLFQKSRQKRYLKQIKKESDYVKSIINTMNTQNGSMDFFEYHRALYVLEEVKLLNSKLGRFGISID